MHACANEPPPPPPDPSGVPTAVTARRVIRGRAEIVAFPCFSWRLGLRMTHSPSLMRPGTPRPATLRPDGLDRHPSTSGPQQGTPLTWNNKTHGVRKRGINTLTGKQQRALGKMDGLRSSRRKRVEGVEGGGGMGEGGRRGAIKRYFVLLPCRNHGGGGYRDLMVAYMQGNSSTVQK